MNGTGESHLLSGKRELDLLPGTDSRWVVIKSVWIIGNTAPHLHSPKVTYQTFRYWYENSSGW